MTLSTTNGQPKKHLTGGISPVYCIGHIEFIRIRPTLFIESNIAIEPGSYPGLLIGISQKIASDIFYHESIIGFIAIKRVDDIVAI